MNMCIVFTCRTDLFIKIVLLQFLMITTEVGLYNTLFNTQRTRSQDHSLIGQQNKPVTTLLQM